MTPFASVAMLEKLALLKIARCRAPAFRSASSRESCATNLRPGTLRRTDVERCSVRTSAGLGAHGWTCTVCARAQIMRGDGTLRVDLTRDRLRGLPRRHV